MERGSESPAVARAGTCPSWGLAGKGPPDLRLPLPPNENELPQDSAPLREAPTSAVAEPGRGPVALGPSAPALLPPRQLAAEPGPPSPGSRLSSPPTQPAAGPLPICRRAQGESVGSRREATADFARGRRKFLFCPAAWGLPRLGLGFGGIRAPHFPLRSRALSSTRGPGSFLGARGEENRSERALLGRPGLGPGLGPATGAGGTRARLKARGLRSFCPLTAGPDRDPGGRVKGIQARDAQGPGTGGRPSKDAELDRGSGEGKGARYSQ